MKMKIATKPEASYRYYTRECIKEDRHVRAMWRIRNRFAVSLRESDGMRQMETKAHNRMLQFMANKRCVRFWAQRRVR
jgi:hypothetical protein